MHWRLSSLWAHATDNHTISDEFSPDLLAVDAEFAAANARDHESVATAPALRGEKDLLLDLLRTDQQVDGAKEGRRRAASGTLHDPYVKEVYTAVEQSGGWSPGDDPVMMQLLAVDESVGDGRRRRQLVQSEASAIIGDLHEVDREVGAARRRALLVEDLQALLDVDHLVDGVTKAEAEAERGGKRSIFSVKEKYTAKVSSKYAK